MNRLFAAQPVAFPDLETALENDNTPMQNMSVAMPIDSQHQTVSKEFGLAQKVNKLMTQMFDSETLTKLLKYPSSTRLSIDMQEDGITITEREFTQNDALLNLARAKAKGVRGTQEGVNTVNMTKGAFLAASMASPLQLLQQGLGPTARAGIYNNAFVGNPTSHASDVFLRRISKFIGPMDIKEVLSNAQVASGQMNPAQRDEEFNHPLDAFPHENLAIQAAAVKNPTQKQQLMMNGIADRIKQQRLKPHYAKAPTVTPIERARRVAQQFTLPGGDRFTIIPNNKFGI